MLICSTNAGSSENRSLLKELYDKYGRTVLGICYDILRSERDSSLQYRKLSASYTARRIPCAALIPTKFYGAILPFAQSIAQPTSQKDTMTAAQHTSTV